MSNRLGSEPLVLNLQSSGECWRKFFRAQPGDSAMSIFTQTSEG